MNNDDKGVYYSQMSTKAKPLKRKNHNLMFNCRHKTYGVIIKMKKLLQIMAFVIMAVLSMSVALAANSTNYNDIVDSDAVEVAYVKINGEQYEAGENIVVELGEELDIKVKLTASANADDVEVSARLIGYDYSSRERVSDASDVFDMNTGDTDFVELSLDVPVRADKQDYELRLDVQSRNVDFARVGFTLRVEGADDELLIRDVIFSPSGHVVAGRALLTQVLLENIGNRDQDDVKVTVRIPSLALEGSVYVEEIDAADGSSLRGDKETSEEIYLRIPTCAPAGVYSVEVEVEFDEYETANAVAQIAVVESDLCSAASEATQPVVEKTVITAPTEQNVVAGASGTTYPIVIQNTGSQAKSYVVTVSGVNAWGTYQVSEMAPVVGAASTKVVYVTVAANEDATSGKQAFAIEIATGDAKQSIVSYANVVEGEEDRSGTVTFLWTVLIVLVVILLILGFIAIIAKLSKNDDEEQDGKAYY